MDDTEECSPFTLFFMNPWRFWVKLLILSKIGSLVGTVILIITLISLYYVVPSPYTGWSIALFLLWVGPVLLIHPFVLCIIVLPRIIYGDWDEYDWSIPIGCARDKVSGKVWCI